jgi:hypothetical protein
MGLLLIVDTCCGTIVVMGFLCGGYRYCDDRIPLVGVIPVLLSGYALVTFCAIVTAVFVTY